MSRGGFHGFTSDAPTFGADVDCIDPFFEQGGTFKAWASDNTRAEPPQECPSLPVDNRDVFERMADDFRELQRRGW
jgi:hypothetical protein